MCSLSLSGQSKLSVALESNVHLSFVKTSMKLQYTLTNEVIFLVKNTPHAPGILFVGVAPRKHVGEGSNVRSETKIFNLETHEFGSNPPFKKTSCHFHFLTHFWRKHKFFEKIFGGKCLITSGGKLQIQKPGTFN